MHSAISRLAAFAALSAALVLSGCATWFFTPDRSARYVDEDGVFLYVDFASDKTPHVTKFITPAGLEMEYKSPLKVRVTAPSGERFVAYENMCPTGTLYVTDDGQWEFFCQGSYCILAERSEDGDGYEQRFEGVVCAKLKAPREDGGRRRR